MPVNIIGVDPGKTVGIAVYLDGRFSSLELPRADALSWITGLVAATYPAPFLAVERFFRGSGRGPARTVEVDAPEVIGELAALQREFSLMGAEQSPVDAKSVCPDHWLQRMRWFNSGHPHANDAARHVKLALMRNFRNEFRQVLEGKTLRLTEEEEAHADGGT